MLTTYCYEIKIAAMEAVMVFVGGSGMQRRIRPLWTIILLLALSLLATGCERPYPGSDASAAQPTIIPIATQPALVPQQPLVTPDTAAPTAGAPEAQEPTPFPIEPTTEPAVEQMHTVQAGDTLFKIALEYGVTVDEIAAANNIEDVNSLEVGQQLIIPAPGTASAPDEEVTEDADSLDTDSQQEPAATEQAPAPEGGIHVVQPGENLFRIGLRYGCTVEELARFNGITTPNRISVGQQIRIPDCNS